MRYFRHSTSIHYFWLLLLGAFICFGVEGVLPDPRFLEIGLDPGRDKITFPQDFEEIFHDSYRQLLTASDKTPLLTARLTVSPDTWLRANGRLNKDPWALAISARRAKIDGSTTNFASLSGETVQFIADFPLDGMLELGYAERAVAFEKPKHLSGRGRIRFTVPLDQDVFALIMDGYGSQWEHLNTYQQAGLDGRLAHQHHFGTYFGEEIILRAGYQLSQISSMPSVSHRVLQVRAGFFYKRGVFLGRLGLTSADSYNHSLTAPFIEMWIDHHSLRTSLTYTENIRFPMWREISSHSLTEREVFGYIDPVFEPSPDLPEEKNKSIHLYGSVEPFPNNRLSFNARYIMAEDHTYPILLEGNETFTTSSVDFINLGAGLRSDYDGFSNAVLLEVNYERLPDGGKFLPYVPRWSVIDSLKYSINDKWGVFLSTGMSEGIRHQLYYPESDPADVEAAKHLTIGADYRYRDFIITLHAENLLGSVYDRYGYEYPTQLFLGVGWQTD